MKKAFISYRRQDTEGYAHSLYDRLRINFDHRQIFMDVDDIKPGDDFVKILQDNLEDCAVLIVVIGKQWLNIENSAGQRRLDNPDDFVRIEVATALEREIPVIPVLVHGTAMPTKAELPDNLKALSQRQAVVLAGVSYEFGIEQLVSSIERYFGRKRNGIKKDQVITTPWYKSLTFKVIWMLFFGFLLIGLLIEEEDSTQVDPIPQTNVHNALSESHSNMISDILKDIPTAPPTSILTDESELFQLAKVMDPPSNIRIEPNGAIICQATSSSVITVRREPERASNGGLWYATNFCGQNEWGFIHQSQIRLRK